MSFFGDEAFGSGIGDLLKNLMGEDNFVEYSTTDSDGRKRTTRRTQKDVFGKVLLDKVITNKKIYFIFDFSDKVNISASVGDELSTDEYGENFATGKKVLQVKEGKNIISQFPLAGDINLNKFESNFNNGILEVSFKR